MKKQTAYIFAAIVVVLIMIALVCMWITGGLGGGNTDPEPTPTQASQPEQSVPPTLTPTPTPSAAPTPVPTPTPTAAPAPTPEQPSGTVISSGTFDSSTGVGINTHTVWTASRLSDGSIELTVSVYARSYSLGIGPRAITVTVNGSAMSGMTRSFDVDSPDTTTDTLIYSCKAAVSPGSIDLGVDWSYKGQYSGQDIDMISSKTTANIG